MRQVMNLVVISYSVESRSCRVVRCGEGICRKQGEKRERSVSTWLRFGDAL